MADLESRRACTAIELLEALSITTVVSGFKLTAAVWTKLASDH